MSRKPRFNELRVAQMARLMLHQPLPSVVDPGSSFGQRRVQIARHRLGHPVAPIFPRSQMEKYLDFIAMSALKD